MEAAGRPEQNDSMIGSLDGNGDGNVSDDARGEAGGAVAGRNEAAGIGQEE